MHDRRRLGGAVGQRPGPGDAEVLHVVLVDLVERAVAPAVVGAPPHQPVAGVRLPQHLVRHRPDRLHRIGRLLGVGGCTGERQEGCYPAIRGSAPIGSSWRLSQILISASRTFGSRAPVNAPPAFMDRQARKTTASYAPAVSRAVRAGMDDSKNYLVRTFEVEIGGEKGSSGTQFIGFDPRSGQVRSWVFDSEGGFSEGALDPRRRRLLDHRRHRRHPRRRPDLRHPDDQLRQQRLRPPRLDQPNRRRRSRARYPRSHHGPQAPSPGAAPTAPASR